MANVVKCQVCSSYYNGAVYEVCPYCSKGKAKPLTSEQNAPEEKKGGIKLPFRTGRKSTENKQSTNNEAVSDMKPITADQYQKTEMIMPESSGPIPTPVNDIVEDNPIQKPEIQKPALDSSPKPESVPVPAPMQSQEPHKEPVYSAGSLSTAISKSGRTVGKYISSATGESIAPVVGWLIGVKGGDYGRPFNLKSGRNKIGRSSDMDVCLNEESVSRSSVGVIAFDSKQKEFSLLPGESDSLCYVNGSALYERVVLKAGDELEFGDSELNKYVFVPLCSESFSWDNYPQNKKEA